VEVAVREEERGRAEPQPRSRRVVVVAGMALLRSALVQVLDAQERQTVVADLSCGEAVVAVASRSRADVVVVDVADSCESCLSVVSALRTEMPDCLLLVLMEAGARSPVRRVMEADVHGLVDRSKPVTHLVEAVERVGSGEPVLDASLAVAAVNAEDSPLTPREAQVLRAAANGLSGQDIARQLSLAPGTVRNYLSSAMTKTGTRTRIEAIRRATDAGWLRSA
jgi:two-component system, NarL family, response regulator DesR